MKDIASSSCICRETTKITISITHGSWPNELNFVILIYPYQIPLTQHISNGRPTQHEPGAKVEV